MTDEAGQIARVNAGLYRSAEADLDDLLTALTALCDRADQQATDDLGNLNDSPRTIPLGLVSTRKIRDLIHDHGGDHE